jgi:membrane-associated protein
MTVLLGRFTVALRVVVPGLAGMADMPYRKFALFNILGALAWGGAMVIVGYLAGSSWHTAEQLISRVGLGVTVALVATLVGVRVLYRRRARRRRSRGLVGHKPVPQLGPAAAVAVETLPR